MHVAIIMNGNGRWAMKQGSRLHLRIVIDYPEHDSVLQSTLSDALRLEADGNFERRVLEIDRTTLPVVGAS